MTDLFLQGWFFSEKFKYYQKVNGKVVGYVSEMTFGFQSQLYYRGQLGFCELDARTSDHNREGLIKMFKLCNEWLDKYSDGNSEQLQKDRFHISNPYGVWIRNREEKNYWI